MEDQQIVSLYWIGIGSLILPHLGGQTGSSNGGHETGSNFMSYAGPVFPLTLREQNSTISAQRNITIDFSPWIPRWISNEAEAASRTELTETERQQVLENYQEWYPEGGRKTKQPPVV